MLSGEAAGAVVFIAVVALIFVRAAGALMRLFRKRERRPFVRWMDRVSLALAAGGVFCIAYGYFVEPYRLSVTRVVIPTSKLPAGSAPIRIAHLSDIHSDPVARLETRLPADMARERPDVIVFTGDAINSPQGLPVFRNTLTGLASIAPTFVVKGNWDAWFWPELNRFGGTGAHELNGAATRLEIRGIPIWIAGVAVENESALTQATSSIPPEEFSVFLYHYPDLVMEAAANHVDLYCAGHTHGGQVALPIYGALITLSRFGKRYESGLYRENEMWMYVNRGIGMEGGAAPRVRFWSPPELTVMDIVPADGP